MGEVWIVRSGEQYEGGSVVSVHATHAGAVAAQKREAKRISESGGAVREEGDVIYIGCDFVDVEIFEVEDA